MRRSSTELLRPLFLGHRKLVIVGTLLALIVTAYCFVGAHADDASTKQASYITSFPSIEGAHWVRPAGLLMAGKHDPRLASRACIVMCRAWNGLESWRVSIPATDFAGWGQKDWNRRAFAVSPNGRVIGVAGAAGNSILCIIWKDGKEISRYALPTTTTPPFDRQHYFQAVVTDDGYLYLWGQNNAATSIIAIHGQGVSGRGTYRTHLVTKPGEGYNVAIAPDGKTLVGYKYARGVKLSYPDFEYASIRLAEGKIIVEYRYTANEIAPILFSDGAVLNNQGARLLATGQVSRDDGWDAASFEYSDGSQLTPKATLQAHGNRWRVLIPTTGTTWHGVQISEPSHISVSHDGRFVVALYATEGIVVYEQPGEIVAKLPFTPQTRRRIENYEGNQVEADETVYSLNMQGIELCNIDAAYVSPDGSSLIISGVRKATNGQYALQASEYHIFGLTK